MLPFTKLLILWFTKICVRFLSPSPPIGANLKSMRILAVINMDSVYLPSWVGDSVPPLQHVRKDWKPSPFWLGSWDFMVIPKPETSTKPVPNIAKPVIKSQKPVTPHLLNQSELVLCLFTSQWTAASSPARGHATDLWAAQVRVSAFCHPRAFRLRAAQPPSLFVQD